MKKFLGFDKGIITSMILIDHREAFSEIDYDVLLQKSCSIGFSKHALN